MKTPTNQRILSETYRDLLAQYGELCIQKQQITNKIKDLEAKLESLNFFAPVTDKIQRELVKEFEAKQDLTKAEQL